MGTEGVPGEGRALGVAADRLAKELLERAATVVLVLAPDFSIREFNPEAERLYGCRRAEVLGANYLERFVPREVWGAVREDARRVLEGGEATRGFENVVRATDGTERVVNWYVSRLSDAADQPAGILAIGHDVTERRRAERFRDEYLALISHDLRSPLTAVLLRAQVLERELPATVDARVRRHLAVLVASARRMDTMINELLEVAHLESGRLELHAAPVDLPELVADVVDHLAPTHQERIRVEAEPALPRVTLDAARIGRALANLLGNALRYSPSDTPVMVRIARAPGQVVIAVIDEGPGIAPEQQPHLFERFHRGAQTPGSEGLGLGLYIARLIVEAHRGNLTLESAPGTGSRFSIALPLE